jgi:diguanylate cyclase (GGDEF)-like protein/PAS domain S-box-containing protein
MEGWTLAPAALLEALPDAVVACDQMGRVVFVNRHAEQLFGYPREELVGMEVQMLWAERVRELYMRTMQHLFTTRETPRVASDAWGRRRDGSEFIGEMRFGVVDTSRGPLLLAIGRDISERRATEARLRAIAALGERALAGGDAGELATEAVELVTTSLPVRGAEVRTTGGAVLAATGAPGEPGLRIPIGTGDALHLVLARELGDEELWLVRAIANTLATAFERLRLSERTRYDAVHDPLTGLANRLLLSDRLRHAVARAGRGPAGAAVLFVDLDRFKHINDHHGHAMGDQVLTALGRRLAGAVRPGDTVARYGGDEFVAVCEGVDETAAHAIAQRMLAAIERPLVLAGVTHELSASIGIALGAGDPDALLASADAAAYRAKAEGGGRVASS